MTWLWYVGIAVAIVALVFLIARARRKQQQGADDIYPMW